MNGIKIINIQKVNLGDGNSKLLFLNTKAISLIKLMGLFSGDRRFLINPLEVINQEFYLRYKNDNLSDLKLYYISVFTLMDVLKFLEKYNIVNRNMLYEKLN